MSLPKQQVLFTPDEYLAFEREAEERHEWLDGLIYAMAGESPDHSLINANLIATLNLQLKGRPCAVFSPNMKVYSRLPSDASLKGLFSYPDVTIVCGKPVYHDEHRDVLINPQVIIEVLSKSTEAYDRGEKFERYQVNRSLTDYLLVSQYRPSIVHYARKAKGRWEYSSETDMTGSLDIASIQCRLLLADVYDRIEFPADAEPESPLV
ncbi:MAG: Uma2 family endonuclease [Acidobacteriota bacterium]